jgi:hypothetical protein
MKCFCVVCVICYFVGFLNSVLKWYVLIFYIHLEIWMTCSEYLMREMGWSTKRFFGAIYPGTILTFNMGSHQSFWPWHSWECWGTLGVTSQPRPRHLGGALRHTPPSLPYLHKSRHVINHSAHITWHTSPDTSHDEWNDANHMIQITWQVTRHVTW